jgi:hypothetical protein
MNKITVITAVLTAFLSTGISSAQEKTEDIRIKVEAVGDVNVAAEVDRFVTEAFSRIEDVEVVDKDPQIYVHIIARRLITNRGRKLGYVLASATSEIFDIMLESGVPYTFGDYNGLWLEMGPDLKTLCEQCVLAADAGVLDSLRGYMLSEG